MSLPWFKFYHQDFLAGTAGLSMGESGAYIKLLAMMYDNDGKVFRDDARLARVCGCPTPNFRAALNTLIQSGKVIEEDGYLTNERVKKELMARENKGAMARKSAASRWQKNQENQSPKNADAMRTHTEVRSQKSELSLSNDKDTRAGRAAADQAFQKFWSIWPNKVGKPVAQKSFAKVAGEVDAICAGVERYMRDKPPDRPWLNPATFLNQRRWEDAPALPLAPARPPQQSRGLAARMLNEIYRKERENGQGQGSAQIVELLPFDRRDVG